MLGFRLPLTTQYGWFTQVMANFISVVVCAYGVQGYLTECLDSVLRVPAADA